MRPTAPPTPAPASAATIGPAAIKGPTPGMARAPIPTSHPSAPPNTAPELAPAAITSGALLDFTVFSSFRAEVFRKEDGNILMAETPLLELVQCVLQILY